MKWFNNVIARFIESGVTSGLSGSDARYVRFLNATLLLFTLAQIPVIALLIGLELHTQLAMNLLAVAMCGGGFMLNRGGYHLFAKVLVISVVTANTSYFAAIMGSSSPTHLWLIPGAVLGILAFKPAEWRWTTAIVGMSIVIFSCFEFLHLDMKPVVHHFASREDELNAAHGSTVSAMILALILVGMMHRRFAWSESALTREKAQSERLLRAILPDKVAQELRETGTTKAVRHEDVSLLFADIVGFTPLSASMPAEDVVALLAEIFKRFDTLITECGVEKIKTIGDAYMIAGGVPHRCDDHAQRLATCALAMMEVIAEFSQEKGQPLQLRIGLHRGPAVAGVIGTTKFAYDLWGESVNLASRLESSGEPGRIQVSAEFKQCLEKVMQFEDRGVVDLKGVGPTRTFWLLRSYAESPRAQ